MFFFRNTISQMRIEKCGRILDYLYYIRNYFTTLRGYSVSGAAVRLEIERKIMLKSFFENLK